MQNLSFEFGRGLENYPNIVVLLDGPKAALGTTALRAFATAKYVWVYFSRPLTRLV